MLYHKKAAGILTGLFILSAHLVFAQEEIALYQGTIPNAKHAADAEINKDGVASKVSRPSLTIFQPDKEKANGAAVIICPGGGYGVLMMQLEGIQTARYFQQHGVAAFVLKYRLPDEMTMQDKSIGPLQDAQQAIKRVRMQAREWNIDTARVGIMGFSAGGHLAATASTHFADEEIENGEKVSLRPDFSLLVYPVISMTDLLGHRGSRDNLLGKAPSPEKIKWFSNEQQVTTETPPAFLIQAADDQVVDVDNSIAYFEALRHHQVPAEMHIYPKGDHGFVLHIPIDDWMRLCLKWMSSNGWLEAK
ncbi:MAG: alpha/beta hydrolase [Bacteroidota bacterium]|nr:alpha/beta hydrolase [Bacteroidota bacterium]MDP4250985.1 alpha/beta hydrolase [Bacteroidota bacterium]